MKFGKDFRKEFYLEEGYIPLNHGSFGTYPKALTPVIRNFQHRAEEHPDRFNRFEITPLLQENLRLLGNLMNCDGQDLGFVYNASSAASTILRSYPFKKGDKIVYLATTYNTVRYTLQFLRDQYGVELVKVDLNFPLEDDEIVDLMKETIERENAKGGNKIVMTVIDAIVSLPGARIPFERITKLVHEYDILSFVDGAHTIGQIAIDIQDFDPDFFFTNCHKWLYSPRGCAVMYVAKRHQGYIHPTTLNDFYEYHTDGQNTSSFANEHLPGTIDATPYLAVKAALEYRESIGGEEAIRNYTHDIAVKGGALVAEMLGTQVLENSTKSYTASLVNVELPPFKTTKSDSEISSFFMDKMVYQYHTMFPLFKHNGKWYIRLAGQIYLDLDDFKAVGEIVLSIIEELNSL